MNTPKEGKRWLIWSIEHNAWWRPDRCGYHGNRQMAGRYGFEEALEIVAQGNIGTGNRPNEAMIEDPGL